MADKKQQEEISLIESFEIKLDGEKHRLTVEQAEKLYKALATRFQKEVKTEHCGCTHYWGYWHYPWVTYGLSTGTANGINGTATDTSGGWKFTPFVGSITAGNAADSINCMSIDLSTN